MTFELATAADLAALTDLLAPETLVERVDAIVLSGGSAFGLDAAAGVMDWLAEAGRGFAVKSTAGLPILVPIVPAAILFDLGFPGRLGWTGEPPWSTPSAKSRSRIC